MKSLLILTALLFGLNSFAQEVEYKTKVKGLFAQSVEVRPGLAEAYSMFFEDVEKQKVEALAKVELDYLNNLADTLDIKDKKRLNKALEPITDIEVAFQVKRNGKAYRVKINGKKSSWCRTRNDVCDIPYAKLMAELRDKSVKKIMKIKKRELKKELKVVRAASREIDNSARESGKEIADEAVEVIAQNEQEVQDN